MTNTNVEMNQGLGIKGLPTLFLTDMDGTLTKGSVVLDHAGYLIEKGLIKDDGSFKAWQQDVKNERLVVAVAENYRSQITGKKISELGVEEFVREYIKADTWYSTVFNLVSAKSNGHEVIIVSGSSDFLVQEVAKQLGFEGVGSKYLTDTEGRLTGEVVGMFGLEAKDSWITENVNKLDYDGLIGLGDTSSDYGIFKHCEYNILVEPTSETMEFLLTKGAKINEIHHEG